MYYSALILFFAPCWWHRHQEYPRWSRSQSHWQSCGANNCAASHALPCPATTGLPPFGHNSKSMLPVVLNTKTKGGGGRTYGDPDNWAFSLLRMCGLGLQSGALDEDQAWIMGTDNDPDIWMFFPSEDVWPKLAVRSPGRGSVLQKLGLWALGGRTKRLLGNNGDKDRSERFTGYWALGRRCGSQKRQGRELELQALVAELSLNYEGFFNL